MILPLAHAEDLWVDLPLFAGPVFVLGGWLIWTAWRARRR